MLGTNPNTDSRSTPTLNNGGSLCLCGSKLLIRSSTNYPSSTTEGLLFMFSGVYFAKTLVM